MRLTEHVEGKGDLTNVFKDSGRDPDGKTAIGSRRLVEGYY